MTGFPTAPAGRVTLFNWQDPPYNRWAFGHMREVLPSHRIAGTGLGLAPGELWAAAAAPGEEWPGEEPLGASWPTPAEPDSMRDGGLGRIEVNRLHRSTESVEAVLADTYTDALVVLHRGHLVEERYAPHMSARTPHLLMSVSKSIVGCVAGILAQRGRLDVSAPVARYVPELEVSGYAGTTVRDLLDMRTGVMFREAYTDPDAEVRVMERSMGWRPLQGGDPLGMYTYLTTLRSGGAHNGPFVYRSADTDALGWVVERAAGTRMADLVSTLLWQPMGALDDAEIACDAVGTAVHDGGVSATARDVARFGQLLLRRGRAGGRQVVPASWVDDACSPPSDVRAAFAQSDNDAVLPGGWYRSQFWFVPGRNGTVLLCLGIHGQLIHVDFAAETVVVKLSSWPDAQNAAYLVDTIRACGAVGAHLMAATGSSSTS
jgi:CubicO group peptidase (beta-lactamase class C family)